MKRSILWCGLIALSWAITGCSPDLGSQQTSPVGLAGSDPDDYLGLKKRPSPSPTASPTPTTSPTSSPTLPPPTPVGPTALIFNGAGTSASNAQSLISIVASHGLTYRVLKSADLEAMSVEEMTRSQIFVWPGGDANVMSAGLSAAARTKIRSAVVNGGMSYVGFCAGAWMAVGPTPSTGSAPYWGLSILNGNYLKVFQPNGQLPVAAMVWSTFASGDSRHLVWWGGPYLPSYAGSVVAKYPDGTSAILQAQVGNGFAVLSGLHPEAPQDWRDGVGLVDKDGIDFDVAWSLIHNSLQRLRVTAF